VPRTIDCALGNLAADATVNLLATVCSLNESVSDLFNDCVAISRGIVSQVCVSSAPRFPSRMRG
jgi:hypothetical protein